MTQAYQKISPIVIFPYNRAMHLQLTLESLERCEGYKECPVYIFCDAPNSNKDIVGTKAVRAVAKAWTEIHGGTVIERPTNLRFRNITEGITEICEKYGRVIVLEEDMYISPDFLTYTRRSLDHYENDPQVKLISGYILPESQPNSPSTFFLPNSFIWGWATWQREWKKYQWFPDGADEFFKDKDRCYRFNYKNGRKYSEVLKRAVNANPPMSYTWDVQYAFVIFQQGGLTLHPHHPLVWNTGMACGAHGHDDLPTLHGKDPLYHGKLELNKFKAPILALDWKFPDKVEVDEEAFDRVCKRFHQDKRRIKRERLWKKIKNVLGMR